jgi:hypothetical protein
MSQPLRLSLFSPTISSPRSLLSHHPVAVVAAASLTFASFSTIPIPSLSSSNDYHDITTSSSRWTTQIADVLPHIPSSTFITTKQRDGNGVDDRSLAPTLTRELQSGVCLPRHVYINLLSSFFGTINIDSSGGKRSLEWSPPIPSHNINELTLSTAFPSCLEQLIVDYLVWPFSANQSVDAQDTVPLYHTIPYHTYHPSIHPSIHHRAFHLYRLVHGMKQGS